MYKSDEHKIEATRSKRHKYKNKKAKKHNSRANTFSKIFSIYTIIGIQLIISIGLVISIIKLNVLPTLYVAAIVMILAIFLVVLWALIRYGKSKTRQDFFKVISLILSIVFLMGSGYVIQTGSFVNSIAGAETQTHVMSVIVMKDSSYENLSDLKGKKYGVADTVDKENLNVTLKEISTKQGALNLEKSADMMALSDALYNGAVDGIVVNEAYRGMLEANHEQFGNETRVIWTFEISEKVKNISNSVDVTKDAFTVYISGIDTYGAVSTVSRSDVNMLVTVNPVTGEILMTSIPRDYYVPLATSGQNDKLTHSGIYGVNESIKTIENFMGVDINYYARVNFTSLETIVDALGGIDVYSDKSFVPWTDKSITIHKGNNHMDGDMALAFSRERYAYTEGDNHRVQNQQAVLKGIFEKITSPAVITNYSGILNAMGGSFETSMLAGDIQKLAKMQLRSGKAWNIMSNQVKGTGSSSTTCYSMAGPALYVMQPDYNTVKQASEYISKVVNGEKVDIKK